MKAKLICDCELEIVTGLDKDGEPIFEPELFRKGTEITFDLIDHPQRVNVVTGELEPCTNILNIQFGDGSMAVGVSKEWLDITQK